MLAALSKTVAGSSLRMPGQYNDWLNFDELNAVFSHQPQRSKTPCGLYILNSRPVDQPTCTFFILDLVELW